MTRAPSVAAAMIVRNEQAFLGQCLGSISGKLDQVVIVDTGSTDQTTNIARDFGAKLLHHPWTGDFSAARNIALDYVDCDWVLYIDADERLSLPGDGRLADFLDPEAIAAYVQFRPKTGYTRYREIRLFRSDPRIRFSGSIHETANPAIRDISMRENLPIQRSRIGINHFGYDGDQAHKHLRNLPLLQSNVLTSPDRVYYWYHLAETLVAMGDLAAAKSAALGGLAAAERKPSSKQRADSSMIRQTLARLHLQHGEDCLALIEQGLALVPDDHALKYLRGKALLAKGAAQTSLIIAQELLAVPLQSLEDGLLAFETRLFEDRACELAALACLKMGDRQAAADYFAQAAKFAPQELSYRVKAVALGQRVLLDPRP